MGVLIITHYQRILHIVQPDRVSILFDGRVEHEGGPELVEQLEREGYGKSREEVGRRGMSHARARARRDFPILDRRTGSPTSTPARRRRSRGRSSTRWTRTSGTTTRPSTAASTRSPPRRPERFEGARAKAARVRRRATRRRDDLHRQRDRGDQPRRVRVGRARTCDAGDRVVVDGDGAPLDHRPVAHARRERGAELDVVADRRRGRAEARRRARRSCSRAAPKLVAVAHVSNVLGTINPIAEIARRGARRRRAVLVDGAQAVPQIPVDIARSAPTSTPGPATRPTARPASACSTAAASCSSAMPPWIGGGHMITAVTLRRDPLRRAADEVRGRHVADRRGGRPRRRGRLPRRPRHATRPRARARARRVRARAPRRRRRPHDPRPARRRRARRGRSRSRSTTPTRTTSPRSSAARASASAPATTARSR